MMTYIVYTLMLNSIFDILSSFLVISCIEILDHISDFFGIAMFP